MNILEEEMKRLHYKSTGLENELIKLQNEGSRKPSEALYKELEDLHKQLEQKDNQQRKELEDQKARFDHLLQSRIVVHFNRVWL